MTPRELWQRTGPPIFTAGVQDLTVGRALPANPDRFAVLFMGNGAGIFNVIPKPTATTTSQARILVNNGAVVEFTQERHGTIPTMGWDVIGSGPATNWFAIEVLMVPLPPAGAGSAWQPGKTPEDVADTLPIPFRPEGFRPPGGLDLMPDRDREPRIEVGNADAIEKLLRDRRGGGNRGTAGEPPADGLDPLPARCWSRVDKLRRGRRGQ